MSTWNTLENLLSELPSFIPDRLPPLHGRDPIDSLDAASRHLGNVATSTLRPLVELLAKSDEFRLFRCGHAVSMSGSYRIDIYAVINWLVHTKRKGMHPSKIVAHLREFTTTNEGQGYHVAAILGFEVHERVELCPNLFLVPFTEVPESVVVDEVFEYGFPMHRAFGRLTKYDPKAALVFPYRIQSVLMELDNTTSLPTPFEPSVDVNSLHQTMDEITRCLTVLGPSAPQILAVWSQYGGDIPLHFRAISFSHSLGDIDPSIDHRHEPRAGKASTEQIKEIIPAYLHLDSDMRAKLRVPLDRLNAAMRRSDTVDRAIELGIALEALLGDNLGTLDSISSAVRIRGTWLHGGSGEQRKDAYDLLRKIYNLRSAAVHQGRLKDRKKASESSEDVLWRGIELCASLIRSMIALRSWPCWDDLILGIT